MQRDELPYVDTHEVILDVDASDAWRCLQAVVARSTLLGRHGFPHRHETAPRCLRLAGTHLFATYQLCFELEDAGPRLDGGTLSSSPFGTRVRATTHARFNRGAGRVYRALVIGSGAHAVIVRRFLQSVRRLAGAGPF